MPDRIVAFLHHAIALNSTTAIHPDPVQAVINGTGTLTNKLRALASLANIQWQHSRGHKKHMRNHDIRSTLTPFVDSELLAQLS